MRHIIWTILAVWAWAGPAALGVDELNLRTDKAELDGRLRALEANHRKMRDKAARLPEVVAARKAIDEARKARDRKEADNPALALARQAEKDAREKLTRLVEAKLAADNPAAGAQAEALAARRDELDYRESLVRIQLEHEGSPIRQKLEADPQVAGLGEKAEAIERDMRARPSDEVGAAAAALRRAEGVVAPLEARAAADPRVVAAARALAEATEARSAARSGDAKLAAVEEAKQAWQAARALGLRRIGEAKDLLDQKAEIDAGKDAVSKELRANAAVMVVHGQMLSPRTYPQVAAARAKLVHAEVAMERAMRATGLAALRESLQAAQQARDDRIDVLLKADKDFQGMLARYAALEKRIAAMSGRVESLSAGEAVELAEARESWPALDREIYNYRQRYWHHPTVEALWKAAYTPYHELGRRMKSTPAIIEAEAARKVAAAELEAVQEAALAGVQRLSWPLDQRRRVQARRVSLLFREAMIRQKLEARGSPLTRQADGDAEVAAALKAYRDCQQDERDNPSAAVAAAEKDLAAAKSAHAGALAGHQDYQRAVVSRRDAGKALQSAERADPRRKAAADARKARDELRAVKLLALPEARALPAEREAIAAARKELDAARRSANDEIDALKKKLEAGGDPQTAAIVQEIEAARKAAKAIESDAAGKQIEAREKAVETRIDAMLATDRDYQAVVGQIDAVKRELGGVEDRLRRTAEGKTSK